MATTPTREEVAAKFAQVAQIINATTQAPTIVNENSRFVVATYWWGKGRENFNTARPCGDFHESLLMEPIHLLSPLTATPTRYKTAIVRNGRFMKLVEKKIHDYQGSVNAHVAKGGKLSTLYTEKSTADLKRIILDTILAFVATVLPKIQEFQQLFIERANLEDTFQRRLAAGLTEKAQLETIRRRLDELKTEKSRVTREIKGQMGPFKQALDRALRYKDPLTYDGMIAEWEETCRKSGCNFLAVEYPEFAAPGGYQLAINAKPRFIQKALELCNTGGANRGVLYIDGDMTVNRYPAIFDMPDVDMMARGWTVDPRSSYKFRESILVDPYTFETSGGTMFFGATQEAALLLHRWIEVSESYTQWGKADDRILSLVFNTYKLLLPLKIVQLPVEYLWLTLDYDDNLGDEDFMDNTAIYLEHPECLTSEDTAAGQGASSDRSPKFYGVVENYYPRSEYLHEAVMFPTAEATAAFRPYLNYLSEAYYFEDVADIDESLEGEAPFHVVPFSQGLGPYQVQADANAAAVSALPPLAPNTGMMIISENDATTIPRILQALQAGYSVQYMPATASDTYIHSLDVTLRQFPRIEFAFMNASRNLNRAFFFNSEFNVAEPAFFRAGSPHLQQLLSCCSTLGDLTTIFRNNYQFLSRIRTHFLKKYRGAATGIQAGGVGVAGVNGGIDVDEFGAASENAMAFLYGNTHIKAAEGGRRKRRTLRRRKQQRQTKKYRKYRHIRR